MSGIPAPRNSLVGPSKEICHCLHSFKILTSHHVAECLSVSLLPDPTFFSSRFFLPSQGAREQCQTFCILLCRTVTSSLFKYLQIQGGPDTLLSVKGSLKHFPKQKINSFAERGTISTFLWGQSAQIQPAQKISLIFFLLLTLKMGIRIPV